MRDLLKSTISLGWSIPLFAWRRVMEAGEPGGLRPAVQATRELEQVVREQERRVARAEAGDGRAADGGDGMAAGQPTGEVAWARPVEAGRLDASRFVVIGEGLAAGTADFALSAPLQRESFPALLARQMQVSLPQRLLQPPGIGNLPGFPKLPVRVPAILQTTVLDPLPPGPPGGDLSVPGFRLSDALRRRPRPPIVVRQDARQTAANLLLGMPALTRGSGDLPTQLEAAVACQPTFAIVCLGYQEALELALGEDDQALADPHAFAADLRQLVSSLRACGSEVLLLNVPDPLDTAALSSLASAAETLRVEERFLRDVWGLRDGDRISVAGLFALAEQMLGSPRRELQARQVLRSEAAALVSRRVEAVDLAIERVAAELGARVFDLNALFRHVRHQGVPAPDRRLTADYLGGFYTLNGYYPGRIGHRTIADAVLARLDELYDSAFPRLGNEPTGTDPVVLHRPAGGAFRGSIPPVPVTPPPPSPAAGRRPRRRSEAIELPPNLEQVLPLERRRSYYGDAIRVVDCEDDRDAQWGSCGDLLFDGLALFDSHLEGEVQVRFSPPVDGVSRFFLSLGGGLNGTATILAAPRLFRWPVPPGRVLDASAEGFASTGRLDLSTGLVTDLQVFVHYRNQALAALAAVNPGFPQVPIAFPGAYGSAWARFDQRSDGLLDLTFFGSTFIPLGRELEGETVRWALPFVGENGGFASIPARGLTLHPHLHLATGSGGEAAAAEGLELPTGTVEELTLVTRRSSFGDIFSLQIPELGGDAAGRSQIAGRLQIQFGERFGDGVSVVVSTLPPGGFLAAGADSPLAERFPGRLSPGPIGHDEHLRFPLRNYTLDSVTFLDDPFDVAVGAVDVGTGEMINEVLHRGFIGQDLFYALVRVEPRVPRASFDFRGPARIERAGSGWVYRFTGEVFVPYPAGLRFPAPDFATSYVAGPGSRLDPFLWLHASAQPPVAAETVFRGEEREVLASIGDRFSITYSLPADPSLHPPYFDYVNHSQGGSFRLVVLSWIDFLRVAPGSGEPDTVTFSGWGSWSEDPRQRPHQVCVQISRAPGASYLSVLVDGGLVSNVNTKPARAEDARP
jgi:hypothetical protein